MPVHVYMIKKIFKLKTDPCGTPNKTSKTFENLPFILTLWVRPVGKDINHRSAKSVIPISSESMVYNLVMSILSKAALKSKRLSWNE